MNATNKVTLNALASRGFGWVAEQVGRAVGASALIASSRNRQLRATVTLHCARVKSDANKSMRSWRLANTRLLNVTGAR